MFASNQKFENFLLREKIESLRNMVSIIDFSCFLWLYGIVFPFDHVEYNILPLIGRRWLLVYNYFTLLLTLFVVSLIGNFTRKFGIEWKWEIG